MLKPNEIQEIENLAYRYMLKHEIATIICLSEEVIFSEQEAINAFNKGRLLRKADLNGKIIELSNQLSSPAILLETKLSDETFLNDKLNK
jgi:hypothetical protein